MYHWNNEKIHTKVSEVYFLWIRQTLLLLFLGHRTGRHASTLITLQRKLYELGLVQTAHAGFAISCQSYIRRITSSNGIQSFNLTARLAIIKHRRCHNVSIWSINFWFLCWNVTKIIINFEHTRTAITKRLSFTHVVLTQIINMALLFLADTVYDEDQMNFCVWLRTVLSMYVRLLCQLRSIADVCRRRVTTWFDCTCGIARH